MWTPDYRGAHRHDGFDLSLNGVVGDVDRALCPHSLGSPGEGLPVVPSRDSHEAPFAFFFSRRADSVPGPPDFEAPRGLEAFKLEINTIIFETRRRDERGPDDRASDSVACLFYFCQRNPGNLQRIVASP